MKSRRRESRSALDSQFTPPVPPRSVSAARAMSLSRLRISAGIVTCHLAETLAIAALFTNLRGELRREQVE